MSCQTCNACCFPQKLPEGCVSHPLYERGKGLYVPLDEADVSRLVDAGYGDMVALAKDLGPEYDNVRYRRRAAGFMKTVDYDKESEKCVAQTGRPGQEGGCAIYAVRPSACSNYLPGNEDCNAMRKHFGIGPELPWAPKFPGDVNLAELTEKAARKSEE